MTTARDSIDLTTTLICVGLFGAANQVGLNFMRRSVDDIKGQDRFSQYTGDQHKQHPYSGMHESYLPSQEQREFFNKHFSQYQHLLPKTLSAFIEQQSLQTPVKFKPLSDCPVQCDFKDAGIVVVGGPPALMSAVSIAKQGVKLTYINDTRRMPIAFGSAWHLEEDAISQLTYNSDHFFSDVLRQAILYDQFSTAEQTGFYAWRTLDWTGWASHPELWFKFLSIALAMPPSAEVAFETMSTQSKEDEQFYLALNKEVKGALLHQQPGSLFVARNDEEVTHLLEMKKNLEEKEGRTFKILSNDEMLQKYRFIPQGKLFFEKTHDRVLSSRFMQILTDYIKKLGGAVENGTLTTIYNDSEKSGGIAEYHLPNGNTILIPFSKIILSLGNQPVLDANNHPLYDLISARGVSMLAYVTVPSHYKLPPVSICGGTNHLTKINEEPIQLDEKTHVYLVRLTAGACITPTVSDKSTPNYDGRVALGLFNAVQKTLGNECKLEPIFVFGCNRQVSKFGQTHWITPFPDVHIQFGAGSAGLIRAPDLAVEIDKEMVTSSLRPK